MAARTLERQVAIVKPVAEHDPTWFKDAVIYELHVRAFCDSSGDGVGDFRGLVEKLDYIQSLGVTAIWLLPFFQSPLRDDGYDIADYSRIHPAYGSLRDFETFLREAHNRDLRVITELVLNHTSDQHEWFQKSRRAKPGDKYRDFYVWSDSDLRYRDARVIFQDFEVSNWTWDHVAQAYYWHRFYHHQPDLNFDNPEVHDAMFEVIDFWLDLGVDGVRLDAVPYLYEREGTNCENLPDTHAFLKKLRRHVDEKYADKVLLAEANQWPEDAAAYFGDGDECHMNFHFPLMPRLFMAIEREDRFPVWDILEQTPQIPDNCQWGLFLRNHDELTLEMVTDEERDYMYRAYAEDPRARVNLGIRRRLAPLLRDNRRKMELMNGLLLSLPGTPIIYYGDEIQMGDNIYLGDRDGVRTPMQWNDDRNAGFSRANAQRLFLPVIIDAAFHYASRNVEVEHGRPHSMLWWMRRIIGLRKQYAAFGRGSIEFLAPDNPKVLAYLRRCGQETLLVVANLSRYAQCVELDLARFRGPTPVELFGLTRFPPIGQLPYFLTLGPYGSAELPGQRTAELHVALAAGAGEGLAPEPFTKLYQRSLYQSMRGHARRILSLLRQQLAHLPASVAVLAERLLQQEEELLDRYRELAERPISALRTRCHGDYHLGQVLFTGKDFVIIDFEGEPDRPIGERRIKASPLRDVAGMIRSFHYASQATACHPATEPGLSAACGDACAQWLNVWYLWTSASYLRAYLAEASQGGFLPQRREDLETLLQAHLLEKAVYELGYELNNRPTWVQIPLEGILQLIAVEPAGTGRNGSGAAAPEPENPHASPVAEDRFH